MSDADRYAGKPFLRLQECYVLKAIGRLDVDQENALQAMDPKLRETFGADGSWFDLIALQMEFPSHLPEKIRQIWEAGSEKASAQRLTVDPHEFARQFVDTNFVQPQD